MNSLEIGRLTVTETGILLFVVVSSLGILSAKLAPGNTIRFMKNVDSWFPNFINLIVFKRWV